MNELENVPQAVASDTPFVQVNHTESLTPGDVDNLSALSHALFQPPVPSDACTLAQTGVLGLLPMLEVSTHFESNGRSHGDIGEATQARYHPGFELPPFDLDLFNMALENEPVTEPTAEEIAAYHFLKHALGK